MLRSVTTRSPNDFEYQETQIIVFAIPNGSNLVVFTYGSYESYLEDMAPSKAIELDAVLIDCSNERASSQDPSRVQWPKSRLRVRKILASGRSAQLARRC